VKLLLGCARAVLRLLVAIRGLARKPLDAELLVKDLDLGSRVAKDAVTVLYSHIIDAKNKRSKMLFDDRRRVFSQVCAYSPEKIKGLEEVYGIKEDKIDSKEEREKLGAIMMAAVCMKKNSFSFSRSLSLSRAYAVSRQDCPVGYLGYKEESSWLRVSAHAKNGLVARARTCPASEVCVSFESPNLLIRTRSRGLRTDAQTQTK